MSNQDWELRFKLCIVGCQESGKTSIVERYMQKTFNDNYINTIGSEIKLKMLDNIEGRTVIFQIWDLAGKSTFRTITTACIRGARGIILTYDITSRQSFDDISFWYDQVQQMSPAAQILLLGNKCDLEDSRQVTVEEGIQKSQEIEAIFMESSAKLDKNIDEAFTSLIRVLVQD